MRVKELQEKLGQPSADPSHNITHVFDHALKKIYSVDSHKRLLFARKNEPNNRWWTSWHDHLIDLLEAKRKRRGEN